MPEDPAEGAPRPHRVLVGVSGGIAAYKAATLVSRLVQAGCEVRCAMTGSATRFLGPLTLRSLSGAAVATSLWDAYDDPSSPHVGLARWADAAVIAPCSANLLARLATGFCDDPVTLAVTALPAGRPLVLAPAMNADMWANPVVQRNLASLRELLPDLSTVGPEAGWQACRTDGAGRMAEPEAIRDAVLARLA